MKRRDAAVHDQPTLWDANVQPAIDKADANANDDWKKAADECLRTVAESHKEFTSDDVCELLEKQGVETHNMSALGPVFLRARNAGLIENTDTMQQTRIARRHRKLTVWRSRIFQRA